MSLFSVLQLPERIQEFANKIHEDGYVFSSETILEVCKLRQEILQNAKDVNTFLSTDGLRKIIIMIDLLDGVVRDKLNIDRMRRLVA